MLSQETRADRDAAKTTAELLEFESLDLLVFSITYFEKTCNILKQCCNYYFSFQENIYYVIAKVVVKLFFNL